MAGTQLSKKAAKTIPSFSFILFISHEIHINSFCELGGVYSAARLRSLSTLMSMNEINKWSMSQTRLSQSVLTLASVWLAEVRKKVFWLVIILCEHKLLRFSPFSCCWGSRTDNWGWFLLPLCRSASGMLCRSLLTWNVITVC